MRVDQPRQNGSVEREAWCVATRLLLEDCRRCRLQADTYRKIKEAFARREAPDGDAVDRLRAFGESLMRGEEPGRSEERASPT